VEGFRMTEPKKAADVLAKRGRNLLRMKQGQAIERDIADLIAKSSSSRATIGLPAN